MTEPRRAPLGARFLVVWGGQALSTVGSSMSAIGVAVWVFVRTGDPAALGMLAAVGTLPVLVAGPVLSAADRGHAVA